MSNDLPTVNEIKLVWNNDADDGMIWTCPDCGQCTVIGPAAANHAMESGHGPPTMEPWMPEFGVGRRQELLRAGDIMRVGEAIRQLRTLVEGALSLAESHGASEKLTNRIRNTMLDVIESL